MRYSLSMTYVDADEVIGIARALETAGFFALTMGDHPVHPVEIAPTYPYDDRGTSSVTAETPQLDPWVSAGAAMAVTRDLRYMTTVYLALFRHPLVSAKAAVTLSGISGGRFLFGLGLGWMREEYDAMGASWPDRGDRFDEVLDIMAAVWRGGHVEHHGRFYDFPPIGTVPAPTAPIPLYFGGHSKRMMRRAAERGSGWICASALDVAVGQIKYIRSQRSALGVDHLPFEFVAMIPQISCPAMERLRDSGVEHVLVRAPWRPDLGIPQRTGPKAEVVTEMGEELAQIATSLR